MAEAQGADADALTSAYSMGASPVMLDPVVRIVPLHRCSLACGRRNADIITRALGGGTGVALGVGWSGVGYLLPEGGEVRAARAGPLSHCRRTLARSYLAGFFGTRAHLPTRHHCHCRLPQAAAGSQVRSSLNENGVRVLPRKFFLFLLTTSSSSPPCASSSGLLEPASYCFWARRAGLPFPVAVRLCVQPPSSSACSCRRKWPQEERISRTLSGGESIDSFSRQRKRTIFSLTTREAQAELDLRMMPFFSMVATSLSTTFSPSIPNREGGPRIPTKVSIMIVKVGEKEAVEIREVVVDPLLTSLDVAGEVARQPLQRVDVARCANLRKEDGENRGCDISAPASNIPAALVRRELRAAQLHHHTATTGWWPSIIWVWYVKWECRSYLKRITTNTSSKSPPYTAIDCGAFSPTSWVRSFMIFSFMHARLYSGSVLSNFLMFAMFVEWRLMTQLFCTSASPACACADQASLSCATGKRKGSGHPLTTHDCAHWLAHTDTQRQP
eukprot:scaffold1619_cov121-Isochrysis_galbana.AAC.3